MYTFLTNQLHTCVNNLDNIGSCKYVIDQVDIKLFKFCGQCLYFAFKPTDNAYQVKSTQQHCYVLPETFENYVDLDVYHFFSCRNLPDLPNSASAVSNAFVTPDGVYVANADGTNAWILKVNEPSPVILVEQSSTKEHTCQHPPL
jgi:hypothetical protein